MLLVFEIFCEELFLSSFCTRHDVLQFSGDNSYLNNAKYLNLLFKILLIFEIHALEFFFQKHFYLAV